MLALRSRLLALLVCVASAGGATAADWSGWRGPTGMGQTDDKNLPLTWNGKTSENVRWKSSLPGTEEKGAQDQNQSSPIVYRGRVFVTVSYWPGKIDPKQQPEHHVACYRTDDGKLLWNVKVEPGPWTFADLRGGYTAPTPAADDERVYVVFGSSVIAALDHDGKQLWRKEIKPFKFDVALAASPVLVGDTVVMQCDQTDKQSRLIGFDRKTGDAKWEQLRPSHGFAHSTPVLADIAGKKQLLVAASNALQGVDPDTGKVLWSCAASGDTVSPVLGAGRVYLDSGRGGTGVAVDPTGTGDVTKTHLKWKTGTMPEGYGSPVIVGEHLYRLHSPGVLKCLKLSNGEVLYSERLTGVSIHASPVAAPGGRIYLASAGKTFVVQAGEKFELLAVNDLGDDGPASPAIADGKLFLKGRKMLYCVATKE
ncbi:PQQ-like beta-propeller repeat protein [Gemmata sp. G18]|uniref:PQQ-like beta-propeller repeat protein n=1 Tax=Gemmata palustris TaxID=2822762 RepID=A0ABS5BTS5_9BACT|nr:PQQ-binding-like beta-propeller repeat protein [Gemmata palustris]MBP3957122.1 PQQ-like beta-propeller repeat protein [Gemmata palustris]